MPSSNAAVREPLAAVAARRSPAPTIGYSPAERAVLGTVNRAAGAAGIEVPISPHQLRHAHASHAIDRDASMRAPRARAGSSSIPGCFFDDDED